MHLHDALDGVAFKMTSFDFNRTFMHKLKIVWILQILLEKVLKYYDGMIIYLEWFTFNRNSG